MINRFLSENTIKSENDFNIFATAIYEITIRENKVDISSAIVNNRDKTLEFKDAVKKICATNETCWILLHDGSVHCYDFKESTLEKLSFEETIVDIAATYQMLLLITSNNQLYSYSQAIHQKVHDFPNHQKIKKLVSGDEHCLILTSNGDLFSLGCGLRGALGHGDVNSSGTPKQIEALAGLKIIDIGAGSFHSVAVSSFGDVYSWGWNTKGQLGLPKVAQHTFKNLSESHQQVFTTPQLLDLEDDNEAIKAVFCGSKHTILRTERNRLFVAGLNNYGQLGLCNDHTEDVDKFTEMPVKDLSDNTRIVCGYWSTYLIQKLVDST